MERAETILLAIFAFILFAKKILMASSSSSSKQAQKQFESANDIKSISNDELYRFDQQQQQAILDAQPWRREFGIFLLAFFCRDNL